MKRINFKLKEEEDAIKVIFPLKKDTKTRRISIIISDNLEYIGHKTLKRI